MNYAVVVGGSVGLFALGWWWAGAREKYTGPRTQELVVDEALPPTTSDDDLEANPRKASDAGPSSESESSRDHRGQSPPDYNTISRQ